VVEGLTQGLIVSLNSSAGNAGTRRQHNTLWEYSLRLLLGGERIDSVKRVMGLCVWCHSGIPKGILVAWSCHAESEPVERILPLRQYAGFSTR
jgi:hypothetical protein